MVLTQRTRLGTCRVCLYRFHTTMVHTRAVLRWPSKSMDPSFVMIKDQILNRSFSGWRIELVLTI